MTKVGGKALSRRLLRAPSIAVALSIAANTAAPAARIERDAPPARVGAAQMPALLVADDAPAPAASPQPAPATPTAPSDKTAQENMFWQSAERSNSIADYKAYLEAFPNGVYAPLARNRISAIQATPASPAAAQTPAPASASSAFGPPPAPVTPEALKAEVGTVDTEQALAMGPPARMELQMRLTALGLYSGPIDGNLGPAARTAIIDWQKRHEVAPTGELGPVQIAALRTESETNFQRLASTAPPVPQSGFAPAAGIPSAFGPPPAPVAPEALKAEVGTPDTEQALTMGLPARMELQVRLKALGLYSGPIDGDLGPGVQAGIIEWQKRHDVAPTGDLGPLQLSTLRIESEAAYQQIASTPPPVVQPVYVQPRHVIYSEPVRAAPPPVGLAVLGILGGIGLGVLGAKLGGGKGGFGGKGGKGFAAFGGKGGKGEEKRKK